MPYTKSSARRAFENDLGKQIEMIRSFGPTKLRNADGRAYIFSSAVALSSVALEIYLETLISQWVTRARICGITHSQIPSELRWFVIFQNVLKGPTERFVTTKDEKVFLESISTGWGRPSWELFDDTKALGPNTYLNIVTAQKRYPSPDNLKAVFRRLGITNFVQQLNAFANTDVELLLKSFNDVRNNFAHEGVLVGFSVRDVVKTVRNLLRIVNAVDRAYFKHVAATYGVNCWPA